MNDAMRAALAQFEAARDEANGRRVYFEAGADGSRGTRYEPGAVIFGASLFPGELPVRPVAVLVVVK